MRKTFVPHFGHVPCVAGRPVFSVVDLGLLISRFALHLKQYASMKRNLPPKYSEKITVSDAVVKPLVWLFSGFSFRQLGGLHGHTKAPSSLYGETVSDWNTLNGCHSRSARLKWTRAMNRPSAL